MFGHSIDYSRYASKRTTDSNSATQRKSELAYFRSKYSSIVPGASQESGGGRSTFGRYFVAKAGPSPGSVASILEGYKSSIRSTRAHGELRCKQCAAQDTDVFPFVSDVTPMAILMILEAIQNHKELSFNPMQPAYTHERPEYLSNGFSFQVTRVPWQQVRVDTAGRVISDAVYKRLNRTASKSAWLEFMKDVVVTHHMTYHVSDMHKRNVVQLLGLG